MLVRHAPHPDVGVALTGRGPGSSLGAAGWQEAERLSERLASQVVDAIYASPRERACETAGAIAVRTGCEVTIAEALDEIDFGDWTGATFADLAGDPRWSNWNQRRAAGCPPGGEPMAAVQGRVVDQIAAWRDLHEGGRVVAVSHQDVIKAALCHVLGLSLDRHDTFDVDPASVSTLVAWQGGAKVVSLNGRGQA